MKILAINSGSSSLKFKLFDVIFDTKTHQATFVPLFQGQFKHYSEKEFTYEAGENKKTLKTVKIKKEIWDERTDYLIQSLINLHIIKDFDEIDCIAHRIVHGGEKYTKPTILNNEVIKDLEENYNDFAPLHNPYAVGIIKKLLNKDLQKLHLGIFDTAFNSTIPKENFLYGLPYEYYEKYKVRRYGFHGISHKFVSEEYQKFLQNLKESGMKQKFKDNKVISCHLGSGSSVCAIKGNRVVDNSFGFSPSENLIMSTRAGELDYDAIIYLKRKLLLSDNDIEYIINNESGLLGISGYTQDMKTLLKDQRINKMAKLAIDLYIQSIIKYIGAFMTVLGGLDVLIFTGGIGEGSDYVRKHIAAALLPFGVVIDSHKNNTNTDIDSNLNITGEDSKSYIFVIPTDEELQMAKEAFEFILKLQ